MINKKEEKVTTNDKKVVKKKSSKQIKSNKITSTSNTKVLIFPNFEDLTLAPHL